MFRATFLGHHGFLFEAESSRLLVDPLLCPRFGHTDEVGLRVYPPRSIDLAGMPSVDAVFLTHEHEGHFDIPSLHLLDRDVPIYVSSRSSSALREILTEMGFSVRLAHPGVKIPVGNLELMPMTADQVRHGVIEEWDVLPYLAYDTAGHGSFFTSVDMLPDDTMWKAALSIVRHPGLWATTNNFSQWNFLCNWLPPDTRTLETYVERILRYHRRVSDKWSLPEALLVIGGGFCFGGDRAFLNETAFTFNSPDLAAALSLLLPNERVQVPVPGQTFLMKDKKLVGTEPSTPFLSAPPPEEWPSRKFSNRVWWLEKYPPATGRMEFPDEELDDLQDELDAFAGHLYAGDHFRHLYSLSHEEMQGRKPTIAFALKADAAGGAYVFEYEPQSCRFVPVDSADPAADYLAVFECWATDLIAYLRCEISPTALNFGRCRLFNACPEAFQFDLTHTLFEYAHPLRQTSRFLELYRRTVARLPVVKTRVRAASAS